MLELPEWSRDYLGRRKDGERWRTRNGKDLLTYEKEKEGYYTREDEERRGEEEGKSKKDLGWK